MAQIQVGIKINNIGPHSNLIFSGKTSSLKTAIYANNGSGKTFISRMFRLIDDPESDKINKLITFGQTSGDFEFSLTNNSDIKSLSLSLSEDNTPIINNQSGYIFHTFNSDYVKENIEALGYRPDGDI